MLDFVTVHYAHVLRQEHVVFLEEFGALPREAQCLYVRLVNRKGRIFARNRIRYPELGELEPLLAILHERAWVELPDARHFDDTLRFLTRSDIYAVLLPRFAGLISVKCAGIARSVRLRGKGVFVSVLYAPSPAS